MGLAGTVIPGTAGWAQSNKSEPIYPGVPCYRLHKVHKLLKDSGIYEQVNAPIEPSFFSSYRKVAAEYTAGTDSSFDPFKLAIE